MPLSQKERGLRRRIGTEKLIGCYTIFPDGRKAFTDIRGEQGDCVSFNGMQDIVIPYMGKPLKENAFYAFKWHLKGDDIDFVIDGTPEEVENDEFLKKLFEAKLSLNGSNLELTNNFQRTIFDEVTGAQHTYIYELLQNANDYPYGKEKVHVNFIVTDKYLFFTHTGAPFSLRNIVGITSINQGEKKRNVDTIGYKGIGFKTVFVNNEYVYLRSGDWSLRFDKVYSESQFAGECPWALMPIPTSEQELESEIIDTLDSLSDDMRVQFALRHKTDASKNIPQLDKVFGDNQILLFIPNVKCVDVFIYGKEMYHIVKDENRWKVNDFYYPIPDTLRKWVADNLDNGNKVPEKFKDITKVRISFAVSKEKDNIVPVENARVYNYLPTELRLGFNFLINADFIPNGSRSGLHDVEWNNHIMKQAGVYFADWWASFMKEQGEYNLNSIFDILPEFNSNDYYGKTFLDGFFQRIVEIPCIPTLKDGEYRLCRINEVIQDRIDFFSQTEQIITDEDFYSFYKSNFVLPHPDIRNNRKCIRLIEKFGPKSNMFNVLGLTRLVDNSKFCEWLKIPKNNIRFNGFLISSTFMKELIGRALFLRNDGRLGIASKIYVDIDKYMDDLDFMEDLLPRIDTRVRVELARYKNWEIFSKSFMTFHANRFSRDILDNFRNYYEWFEGIDESIKFIHFLATTFYQGPLPEAFPIYNQEGKLVKEKYDLYQRDEFGNYFAKRPWIKKEWIQFINSEYFKRDTEIISKFFINRQISFLAKESAYTRFIDNKSRITLIAEFIKNQKVSIDFYRFLCSIQQHTPFFSQEMRNAYTILATDGENEAWISIGQTIFKQDEEWQDIICKSWMPKKCCWAITNIYFDGLDIDEIKRFQSFLAIKQVIQSFSVGGLLYSFSISRYFAEVYKMIKSVQVSREFLLFLWEYNKDSYKIISRGELSGFPVATIESTELIPLNDIKGDLYIPNNELLNLYGQVWFDKGLVAILSTEYDEVFDNKEKRAFFANFGLKQFKMLPYIRECILPNLIQIKPIISERENNIAFHRFFASIHTDLSEKELAPLLDMPIFISSPTEKKGILHSSSTNHYLPSPFLSEIISLDLVPVEIMDSIHPDYVQNDNDIKYLETKLGNVSITPIGFVDYISDQGKVMDYLEEETRNINFWDWVSHNVDNAETLSTLKDFPIITQDGEFDYPDLLYISNCYLDNEIEQFVNRFVKDARYVSPLYKERNSSGNWQMIFSSLGVKTSTKEILFKDAMPNLENYKDRFILLEIAKYVDIVKSKVKNKDKKIIDQLSNLRILCDDGAYRIPKESLVSGQYFDISRTSYPDIKIHNLVSEAYIADCGENHNLRRQVIELMKLLGDTFESKCENSTQLRNKKLDYFVNNQHKFSQDECHYRIISELTQDFNDDELGISLLLKDTTSVKLMNQQGVLCEAAQLYFGTSFNPPCDFEGNGITAISYVSDDYNKGTANCSRLFSHLGVRGSFTTDNIYLLKNEEFSVYFWTQYAPDREKELQDICTYEHLYKTLCIPSFGGVKKPCELYSTSNSRLNKIIEQLPDGKAKQPRINLPKWFNLGLRSRLFISDCLEYLKIETLDYRQDVMSWLCETPDEVIRSHGREINEYKDVATWYTGSKTWAPLKELVAIEWADGSSALKDSFGGNKFVCNPSNMPETKAAYDRICKILGIKILTERDFRKQKDGKCIPDNKAKQEIDRRLLYIAYKIDKKDWKNKYKEFQEHLYQADIEQCQRILYFYNENICSDDIYSYVDDPFSLWYVGEWDGKRFEKVLEWILNTFKLKNHGFTKASLEKMFEMSMNQYLQKYEAGSMPEEFLAMLEEAEKAGLHIDTNASYEEGVGDDDSGELSDEHISEGEKEVSSRRDKIAQPHTGTSHRTNQAPKEREDEESDDDIREDHQSKPHKQNRQQESAKRSVNKSNTVSSSKGEEKKDERSLEERMEEKWENQRRKGIQRPQGSGYKAKEDVNDIDLKSKSENKSENPDFFSNRKSSGSLDNSAKGATNKSAEEMRRRQTEAEHNADNAKEQNCLFEIWKDSKPYSFRWFKYLMELQFDDKDKKLPAPIQIDFYDWTTMDDQQKVLRMVSPTRNIPKWIEDAQDIKVTLIGASSHVLNCAIVSVDGEGIDLLIRPDDLSRINIADKIRINAQNHTNFIDSLQTSFLDLNYDDDYQLDENLPENIKFIYGPPGTGKTTRLVELLAELLVDARAHQMNVLVLTPTNKAADVIAEKLFDDEICHDAIVRFGYTDCTRLMSGDSTCFQNRDTMDLDDRDDNIMVTTIARFAYDTIQPTILPISEIDWDYIVVDEASMVDIVPITYLLHKVRQSKFIIAGDPKQITPIPQHNMPAYNIYDMVGLDSFSEALSGNTRFPVEGLTVQHRSIPVIGNLISKFCYQGFVKNDPKRATPKKLALDGLKIKHLNFLGFKVQELDLLYGLTQINDSAFHLYSVIFAYNLVKYMVDQIGKNCANDYSIGIVCPYKAQSDAIQQMLENRPLDNEQCEIICGTVHKFQGDECDIMLLVLNPPPKTYSGSHINNTNIINVAMSRARDYIFFLMPEKTDDGYQIKDRLGEIVDNKDRTITFCGDIEQIIFGDSNFIYDNTNIQCHQLVNVFYDNRAKYEVRISDTALDIQIND